MHPRLASQLPPFLHTQHPPSPNLHYPPLSPIRFRSLERRSSLRLQIANPISTFSYISSPVSFASSISTASFLTKAIDQAITVRLKTSEVARAWVQGDGILIKIEQKKDCSVDIVHVDIKNCNAGLENEQRICRRNYPPCDIYIFTPSPHYLLSPHVSLASSNIRYTQSSHQTP